MNTTTATSTVRKLMAALEADVTVPTPEFLNTGGGCMNVEMALPDGGWVCVSDHEGPFTEADLDSDEDVSGFCVMRYNADGEPVEPVGHVGEYHFLSDVDADGYTVGSDIPQVVAVVRAVFAGVL